MPYIILLAIFLLLMFLPQWWVKHVMQKYSKPINALPGTGGELAQHLIDHYQIPASLEITEQGDHYDPQSKTVRLSPQYFNGKSLTAIAIAAHEVGHAIQDHKQDQLLNLRGVMVKNAQRFEKLGSGIILTAPLLGGLAHSPAVGIFIALIGLLSMGSIVLVHLVSLPVEFDASFNKALPVLEAGNYVTKRDLLPVRQVLLAAALTYVAAALASLLNVGRWLAILLRR